MSEIERFPRDADSTDCPCGGRADEVECTREEIERFDCFRRTGCCARAFVCRVCKKRIVGKADAPEADFD